MAIAFCSDLVGIKWSPLVIVSVDAPIFIAALMHQVVEFVSLIFRHTIFLARFGRTVKLNDVAFFLWRRGRKRRSLQRSRARARALITLLLLLTRRRRVIYILFRTI